MAPEISDVYTHYRGENVPDDEFFRNALGDGESQISLRVQTDSGFHAHPHFDGDHSSQS